MPAAGAIALLLEPHGNWLRLGETPPDEQPTLVERQRVSLVSPGAQSAGIGIRSATGVDVRRHVCRDWIDLGFDVAGVATPGPDKENRRALGAGQLTQEVDLEEIDYEAMPVAEMEDIRTLILGAWRASLGAIDLDRHPIAIHDETSRWRCVLREQMPGSLWQC